MTETYAPLRELFSEAGYAFVEPPLLYDGSVFVELAGEDLRRRLYLTADGEGTELALRPDFTIPVCLHHLATGTAARRAAYAYLGPVFRQRAGEPGEFLQAGVESLGRTDRADADADMLKLALDALACLGVADLRVKIGDSALFAALIEALDLVEPWRRRLGRAFGDPPRVAALLRRFASGGIASPPRNPRLAGVDIEDRRAVQKAVELALAEAGMGTAGGRSAEEIAERFIEQSALAAGAGANGRAGRVLERFLAIAGDPAEAIETARRLARAEKLDVGAALDQFERRLEGFARHGIDLSRLTFAADFGRRLDYYTGFVFEIFGQGDRLIVGGGRYDRLLGLIVRGGRGLAKPVPAVGFAIWLDRVGTAP